MNKIAEYVMNVSKDFNGEAFLFHCTPPLAGHSWVISSAVDNEFAQETMVFPATSDGKIMNWGDLFVHYSVNVEAPLIAAGYRIVGP